MGERYRIKGWKKFQHFKDRKPIWIKLYHDLLDDMEWHELDGDSAKALVGIWLIASENDGILPEMKRLAFRLRMTEKACTAICQNLSHYLERFDNDAISDVYQDDSLETEKRREEIQEETEIEEDAREEVRAAPSEAIEGSSSNRPKKKGTVWPSDAVVPDDWIDAAADDRRAHGLPEIDLRLAASRFQHFWSSDSKTKKDWRRTWMNWALSEKSGHGKPNGQHGSTSVAGEVFGRLYATSRSQREAAGE